MRIVSYEVETRANCEIDAYLDVGCPCQRLAPYQHAKALDKMALWLESRPIGTDRINI